MAITREGALLIAISQCRLNLLFDMSVFDSYNTLTNRSVLVNCF